MAAEPLTIPAVLGSRRDRGDHPLLVCDADRLGYAEADQRSAELACGLIALGAGKGTHVGLLFPNGTQFAIAMLAAARIGAVVVPFSTFATAPELRTQLVAGDIAIMLAGTAFRGHDYRTRMAEVLVADPQAFDSFDTAPLFSGDAPALRHLVFDLDGLCSLGESLDQACLTAIEDDVDGSDPLAIVYTSGSTGEPKGAVHAHAGLLHQQNLNSIRGLTAQDRLFCNSPFFWIGGFAFGLLATLIAGATLVCSNATDAGATLDLLEAEKPTITNGFAAAIARLAQHPSFGDRDLSMMRHGNLYPIMPPETRPADSALRHNMLGMTEAGSVLPISADESDQPEHRRGSYDRGSGTAPAGRVLPVQTDDRRPRLPAQLCRSRQHHPPVGGRALGGRSNQGFAGRVADAQQRQLDRAGIRRNANRRRFSPAEHAVARPGVAGTVAGRLGAIPDHGAGVSWQELRGRTRR